MRHGSPRATCAASADRRRRRPVQVRDWALWVPRARRARPSPTAARKLEAWMRPRPTKCRAATRLRPVVLMRPRPSNMPRRTRRRPRKTQRRPRSCRRRLSRRRKTRPSAPTRPRRRLPRQTRPTRTRGSPTTATRSVSMGLAPSARRRLLPVTLQPTPVKQPLRTRLPTRLPKWPTLLQRQWRVPAQTRPRRPRQPRPRTTRWTSSSGSILRPKTASSRSSTRAWAVGWTRSRLATL
mmetsp:Transcript_14980/g.56430  ORF Transcript_14980/g.56430 Transcript_14980/m.56430 type:complete len:238 (-) Transcript_14980:1010-1723(-)